MSAGKEKPSEKVINLDKSEAKDLNQLEWVNLMREMEEKSPSPETMGSKMKRKFMENPLVPIGCLATSGCLAYGLACMRSGDSRMQQIMMRGRIACQGFTLCAIFVSLIYTINKRSNSSNN